MKKIILTSLGLVILPVLLFTGCEDYLVRAPESEISEQEVFGSFENYQGFVEQMYDLDPDVTRDPMFWASFFYLSEFTFYEGVANYTPGRIDPGNYTAIWGGWNVLGGNRADIYDHSWRGIRVANQSLANLDKLVDATEEERNLIKGQAYFFRGYFHWRLAKYWGGLPYVDTLLTPSSNLKIPRHNWQATAEKIVKDLDRAADLLPMDWDNHPVGQLTRGNNEGRATKGAAMAYKAKVLLFAGSPLMNRYSGESPTSGLYNPAGDATYDHEYLERAALAAWEVLKLSEDYGSGDYGLVSWDNYHENFWSLDGSFPWTKETIWNRNGIKRHPRSSRVNRLAARVFVPANWGGHPRSSAPTQNMVDQFEASNGYPINHPQANYDPNNPWDNRDPRFDYSILIDQEKHGNHPNTVPDLYEGGVERRRGGYTGYLMEKFWPAGANKWDGQWSQYIYTHPAIRLAEMYLIYAEAVNEVWGAQTSPPFDGAPPTAVEVVNDVRSRANHVAVPGEFTGSKTAFREIIRNEREVELCFEVSSHWHDIRRWYVSHKEEYKIKYGLVFDKDHTFFRKESMYERVFDEKHYWLPFPDATASIYSGWRQNPGW